MPKINRAMKDQRVHEVMQLILAGAEHADIRQFAIDKGWGINDRQIWRYMDAAYERIAKSLESDAQRLLARHLMQRRALYARCLKANDRRTALEVLRDEANLLGIYPPKKIAPTSPDGKDQYDPYCGLAEILPELQAALDRLGCGLGPEDPAAALSLPDLGTAPARLGVADGIGGPFTGSLAEEVTPLEFSPELASLLQAGGQEHGNGRSGTAGGSP